MAERARETKRSDVLRAARAGALAWRLGSDTVHWSPELGHLFGADPPPVTTSFDESFTYIHDDHRERLRTFLATAIEDGREEIVTEYPVARRDGVEQWVRFTGTIVTEHGERWLRGLVVDITERHRADVALARSHRALRVLGECSRVVVEADGEETLAANVCRELVDSGGYTIAWIGFAVEDAEKSVRIVARAGTHSGVAALSQAHISWDERNPLGRSPAAIALRTGRVQVCRDVARDPRFAPWAQAMAAERMAAVVTLPFRVSGRSPGVLAICAPEPGSFEEDEIALLRKVSDTAALGLESLVRRDEARLRLRQLAESEARLRLTLNSLPVIVWEVDRDLRFTKSTGSALAKLGLQPSQINGLALTEYFGDSGRQVVDAHQRALDGHSVTFTETWMGRVWDSHVEPLRDAEGHVTGCLGLGLDVTEKLAADRELRLLSAAVDQSTDGIAVVDMDRRVHYVNPAWASMHVWTVQEAIGKLVDVFHTREQLEGEVRQSFEDMRARGGFSGMIGHVTRDGREFKSWMSGSIMKDGQGRPQAYLGIARDMTAQIEEQQELRLLSTAIQQSAAAILIADPSGVIRYVNPAFERMSGYTAVDVLGQTPRMFNSRRHDRAFFDNLWKTVLSGLVWHDQIVNRRKDGSLFECDAVIQPVTDEDGRVVNFVMSSRDVTRERTLERQLRQAQKMEAIGTLAGGIAHDFNNILSAILGYSELVRERLAADEATRADLDEVIKAAHRATGLVRQILHFSRQRETELAPVSLAPILKEALKLMRASLPSTIQIRADVSSADHTVLADPTQIHQVVMNLCTNAFHAMRDKGGTLSVSLDAMHDEPPVGLTGTRALQPEAGWLRLRVSDTGCGIDPAIVGRIFDPFFTTKPVGEGTGMGLATTLGIVTSFGGHIGVKSDMGSGTTFDVYLPRAAMPAVVDDVQRETPRGTERVLWVDDEEPLAQLGQQMLEGLGYRVSTFTDSRTALDALRSRPGDFDVVVTDQTMPHLTGAQLAEAVHWEALRVPIIIVTGYGDQSTAHRVSQYGVRTVLRKPLLRATVSSAIRALMDERSQ